jgi:hypothetical protein
MDVPGGWFVILVFIDDVLANSDALIANEDRRTRDQFPNVILTFIAE